MTEKYICVLKSTAKKNARKMEMYIFSLRCSYFIYAHVRYVHGTEKEMYLYPTVLTIHFTGTGNIWDAFSRYIEKYFEKINGFTLSLFFLPLIFLSLNLIF